MSSTLFLSEPSLSSSSYNGQSDEYIRVVDSSRLEHDLTVPGQYRCALCDNKHFLTSSGVRVHNEFMHPEGGKYDSDKELLPEGWEDYNGEDVYFDDDSDSESDEDSSFEDDECDSDVALSSFGYDCDSDDTDIEEDDFDDDDDEPIYMGTHSLAPISVSVSISISVSVSS